MAGIKILSERLRETRESMKMNQADFAKLIGVTQQSLSSYEKCVSKPTLDVAIKISEKCDISLSWLCGLSDRASNNKVFKTYTDIIDMFFDIMSIAHLDVYSTKVKAKNWEMQDVIMWGISFTDKYLNEFLADWQKMRTLYLNQTIDEEVYSLWREKTIKKYNFPIVPEIIKNQAGDFVLSTPDTEE
jgi:Predicted transcriptional regulator